MRRDQVVQLLTLHREDILAFGVMSIDLFGSTARDEPTASDVDMLVIFDNETPHFKQHMGLLLYLESLLGCTVDLATPRMIRPELEAAITADLYPVLRATAAPA